MCVDNIRNGKVTRSRCDKERTKKGRETQTKITKDETGCSTVCWVWVGVFVYVHVCVCVCRYEKNYEDVHIAR